MSKFCQAYQAECLPLFSFFFYLFQFHKLWSTKDILYIHKVDFKQCDALIVLFLNQWLRFCDQNTTVWTVVWMDAGMLEDNVEGCSQYRLGTMCWSSSMWCTIDASYSYQTSQNNGRFSTIIQFNKLIVFSSYTFIAFTVSIASCLAASAIPCLGNKSLNQATKQHIRAHERIFKKASVSGQLLMQHTPSTSLTQGDALDIKLTK